MSEPPKLSGNKLIKRDSERYVQSTYNVGRQSEMEGHKQERFDGTGNFQDAFVERQTTYDDISL